MYYIHRLTDYFLTVGKLFLAKLKRESMFQDQQQQKD